MARVERGCGEAPAAAGLARAGNVGDEIGRGAPNVQGGRLVETGFLSIMDGHRALRRRRAHDGVGVAMGPDFAAVVGRP